VIFDRCGRYPEFVEHFHKMFARSQNALRGRWENFWASEQVCVVKLVDRDAVMDKLVYTAANPVQDHLVSDARARACAGTSRHRQGRLERRPASSLRSSEAKAVSRLHDGHRHVREPSKPVRAGRKHYLGACPPLLSSRHVLPHKGSVAQ
jgi:hypothetical protein